MNMSDGDLHRCRMPKSSMTAEAQSEICVDQRRTQPDGEKRPLLNVYLPESSALRLFCVFVCLSADPMTSL